MIESRGTGENVVVGKYAELYPDEFAAILEGLPITEVTEMLAALPEGGAAAVFPRLSPETATASLAQMRKPLAASLVSVLEPSRAAPLLARLDGDLQAGILAQLPEREVKNLRALMTYPPGTAAQLMDSRVTSFRMDTTVEQALARLRGTEPRRVYNVFLVDGEGRLVGVVPLQDAALAAPETRLEDLVRGAPASVPTTANQEEVVEILGRHKLASFPVVDFEGRLVGVIRHDTLVSAAEQEASADLQSMFGAGKEERALSKVSFAVRKRLPWLQINLATAFLAASVVGIFEETIAQFTALAVLLPVVAGQSGNTGAQSLAVVMRGLALREITLRQWMPVAFKELAVASLNGVAVAVVTVAGVYIWSGNAGLCLVIGLAMVISMAIAGVAGGSIPLLLDAMGQDPAQSSSIVLTTVTDVFGFFSFLGLATALSNLL